MNTLDFGASSQDLVMKWIQTIFIRHLFYTVKIVIKLHQITLQQMISNYRLIIHQAYQLREFFFPSMGQTQICRTQPKLMAATQNSETYQILSVETQFKVNESRYKQCGVTPHF